MLHSVLILQILLTSRSNHFLPGKSLPCMIWRTRFLPNLSANFSAKGPLRLKRMKQDPRAYGKSITAKPGVQDTRSNACRGFAPHTGGGVGGDTTKTSCFCES